MNDTNDKFKVLFFDPQFTIMDVFLFLLTREGIECFIDHEKLKTHPMDIVICNTKNSVKTCLNYINWTMDISNADILVLLDHEYETERKKILSAGADLVINWSPESRTIDLMDGIKSLLRKKYSEEKLNKRMVRDDRDLQDFFENLSLL